MVNLVNLVKEMVKMVHHQLLKFLLVQLLEKLNFMKKKMMDIGVKQMKDGKVLMKDLMLILMNI